MTQADRKEPHHSPLPKMRLNGVIRAAGGTYEKVEVDGVGRITGDVRAASLVRMNGVLTVEGSLTAPELAMDGKMKVEGGLKAGSARMNGIVKLDGSVKADSLELNGILTAVGSLDVERLEIRGAVTLKGLMNAGSAWLGLSHKASEVEEIGGDKVTVALLESSRWSRLWNWAVPKSKPLLTAVVIEGDEVKLEHTHADVVRGSRVTIGKGCKIGRVEYRDQLRVHPDAIVSKEERRGG